MKKFLLATPKESLRTGYWLPLFLWLAGGLATDIFSQQQPSKGLDAKYIAANYYKGIVKILLYDSVAAKTGIHSGYVGRGSGFIVNDDGIVFTNRHVIDLCVFGYLDYNYNDVSSGNSYSTIDKYSEDKINDAAVSKINYTGYATPIVQVYYGKAENEYKLYVAKVLTAGVGSFDGAMLKIISDINGKTVTEKFSTVPIGNSDSAVEGEDLCVYGFPAQYDGGFDLMLKDMSTLTFGKLSGYDYVFNRDYGYIKTDASINGGNSGGPVFNETNKVIGIATATGGKTNIGLVGGINGMFYVVAPKSEVLRQLCSVGLAIPRSAGSINTITGERKSILSAEELNKNKKNISSVSYNATSPTVSNTSSGVKSEYYKHSKISFHNLIDTNGTIGPEYSSFGILGDGLDYIYILVNNGSDPLSTEGLIVDVYKKSGSSYNFVETKKYTISGTKPSAYFTYHPASAGDYRFSVYNNTSAWINDGYVTFNLKTGNTTTSSTSTEKLSSSYFAKSKVAFTNSNENVLNSTKHFSEFSIGKDGGVVYVIVDNYPNPLKTTGLIVDIWKKKDEQYDKFVETKRYDITSTNDYFSFKYLFMETGEYKISVYTKDEVWINSGYVKIVKK